MGSEVVRPSEDRIAKLDSMFAGMIALDVKRYRLAVFVAGHRRLPAVPRGIRRQTSDGDMDPGSRVRAPQ